MTCKVRPHNSFPKFLLMRTRQPEGTLVKLVKTKHKYTEEMAYWPFKENTKDELIRKIIFNENRSEEVMGTYFFEARGGFFELTGKPKQDEAAERGAPSEKNEEKQFASMAQKRRYEYLKYNR